MPILWQDWHENTPDFDIRGSKNSIEPRSILARVIVAPCGSSAARGMTLNTSLAAVRSAPSGEAASAAACASDCGSSGATFVAAAAALAPPEGAGAAGAAASAAFVSAGTAVWAKAGCPTAIRAVPRERSWRMVMAVLCSVAEIHRYRLQTNLSVP